MGALRPHTGAILTKKLFWSRSHFAQDKDKEEEKYGFRPIPPYPERHRIRVHFPTSV